MNNLQKKLSFIVIALLMLLGVRASLEGGELKAFGFGAAIFLANIAIWILIARKFVRDLLKKGKGTPSHLFLFGVFILKVVGLGIITYFVVTRWELDVLFYALGFGITLMLLSLSFVFFKDEWKMISQ